MPEPGAISVPSQFPVNLTYNQLFGSLACVFQNLVPVPYIMPYVVAPLAPGASTPLIDVSTGLPYFIVQRGYMATQFEWDLCLNQDVSSWLYVDGILVANNSTQAGGAGEIASMKVSLNTGLIDPNFQNPHTIAVVVYNIGVDIMLGGIDSIFLIQEMGSPPLLKTKDARCPFCGTIQTVTVDTTRINCSNCKKLFILKVFPHNKTLENERR